VEKNTRAMGIDGMAIQAGDISFTYKFSLFTSNSSTKSNSGS